MGERGNVDADTVDQAREAGLVFHRHLRSDLGAGGWEEIVAAWATEADARGIACDAAGYWPAAWHWYIERGHDRDLAGG